MYEGYAVNDDKNIDITTLQSCVYGHGVRQDLHIKSLEFLAIILAIDLNRLLETKLETRLPELWSPLTTP